MKDIYTISEKEIEKILQKYHLGHLTSFKEITSGLINPVFVINNEYILRINTKTDPQSKLKFEKESYLYTLLSTSNIPVPKSIAFDDSCVIINEDYLLTSYIRGNTLTVAFNDANKDVKCNLAYQLGQIAKNIHSVDIGEIFKRSDLFVNQENWKNSVQLEFTEYLNLVKSKQLLSGKIIEDIESVSKEFTTLDNLSEKFTLLHGDFSCNNIQVRNGKIVGVIDFEMASIGDPFYDLQKLPINFQLGDEFNKSAFLAGYRQTKLSSDEKTRLKRFALSQGLWEIWATETKQFPFGENEILEGKDLIQKALVF